MGSTMSNVLVLLIAVLFLLLVGMIIRDVTRMVRRQRQPPAEVAAMNAAGWYPQPDGTQRYWDGATWTEHTAP